MINIRRTWQPLTATPFLTTAAHREIPPCEPLQRWIRCFWGGIAGAGASPTRIIPDVCADLIYHIDETAGRIIQSTFCGVSDVCCTAHMPTIPGHTVTTFAIRFHSRLASSSNQDGQRGAFFWGLGSASFSGLPPGLPSSILSAVGLGFRPLCAIAHTSFPQMA